MHLLIALVIVGGWSGSVSGQRNEPPFSVNNPFIRDPSGDQLPLWARSHPFGPNLRTTDASGNPLSSNTASLALHSVASRNLVQPLFDIQLINKHAAFNRERIPERVVHARGQGAFGHFVTTHNVARYTVAKVFNGQNKVTPVFVRFSSTAGGSSSADTTPDARGFALRFYTEDGNLDLTGLQITPFTVRDPMIFPDLQRSNKPNPATHAKDPNQFFDFFSLRPEIVHQFVRVNSDNARPGSMRGINGSNVVVNACTGLNGTIYFCKFSWTTWQHVTPFTDAEAIALAGSNPDFYTQELYNSIATGNYPKWTFGMQVMSPEVAYALPFNPFDPTKFWRTEQFPFIPIGVFVLDRNPSNFFTDVEQAAFDPGSAVPGVGPSPDKLSQARSFAYRDAQRYRLGSNFQLIQVNRPLSPVDSYERDGVSRISSQDNGDGGPVYFPNTFGGPSIISGGGTDREGGIAGFMARVDSGDDDNFSQASTYLAVDVGVEERGRIAGRIARSLSVILPAIRARVLLNCIYPLGRDFGDSVVRELEAFDANN